MSQRSQARSARYTAELMAVLGRAAPEEIGYLGETAFDHATTDVTAAADERDARALDAVAARLTAALATETDTDARTDLVILIDAAQRLAERTRLSARLMVHVPDVGELVYKGLAPLLDRDAAPARRAAGARRVGRYLGEGATPLVDAAIARVREDLAANKRAPTRTEVEEMLANLPALRAAIVGLLEPTAPTEAQALGAAIDHWRAFVTSELLPAAHDDFRLPPAIYAMNLRDAGVTDPPAELAARARLAYDRTLAEWTALARRLAAERHLPDARPTAVLAALKLEQRTGPALQALFEQRILEVEAVIRRERLMTLPDRPLLFRPATPAEAAINPSPSIDTQGFLAGARTIAVVMPGAPAMVTTAYDDFTYDAAAWPLLVHEGRPGHEMQFTTAAARGLSPARTLFAWNAANLEGWALYAEEIMRPFMPQDSRFVALHYLLVRQARAFLDPGLQSGQLSVAEARDLLRGQLGVSEALAESELRRYTFKSPGQATAYFFGLEQLEHLRRDVERALGARFDQARFHDAILHQGFAPLALLTAGVERELLAPNQGPAPASR